MTRCFLIKNKVLFFRKHPHTSYLASQNEISYVLAKVLKVSTDRFQDWLENDIIFCDGGVSISPLPHLCEIGKFML